MEVSTYQLLYQGLPLYYTVTVPVHRFILNTLTRIPAPLPLAVGFIGSSTRRRVSHDDKQQ
jgi:hypothetical protein